jgi:probable F420-dependent oxidoreductase
MARFKVGVQLRPQHCTMNELREAWLAVDALEADTLWIWDHFYPLFGEPDGPHYECWTTLAAIAATTKNVQLGALVSSNSYRNPELLADMARTTNEISGGRAILGIGAGWFERDYDEYGYEFGTAPTRLKALREALPRIKSRLVKLNPPAPDLPLMIGGGGEKVTLRLVAEYAKYWNVLGDPDTFRHKSAVLDEWCAKLGRDPQEIDRTVLLTGKQLDQVEDYLKAGATHVIFGCDTPFDLSPVQRLLETARG